jgi:hypothetical protein
VKFKDLGLVVIDEEQRFGVKHKEVFKRWRAHVDVLSMSATPIPRTLYLALTGARDLSVIETPPANRHPIQTIVKTYDEKLVVDAIRHEIRRGGQVFYLHNRVLTIDLWSRRACASCCPTSASASATGRWARTTWSGDDRFRRRQIPGARLHHDHRERPGYPELQHHPHHRGRRPLRPLAALPAPRARRPVQAPGLRLPAAAPAHAAARHRGSGSTPSASTTSSAPASASRCATSSCAAPATCSAPSRAATSSAWASSSIASSCARGRAPQGREAPPPIRASVKLDFVFVGEGAPAAAAAAAVTRTATRCCAMPRTAAGAVPVPLIQARIPPSYLGETRLRIDFYRRLALAEVCPSSADRGRPARPLRQIRRRGPGAPARHRNPHPGGTKKHLSVETEGNRLKCLREAAGATTG